MTWRQRSGLTIKCVSAGDLLSQSLSFSSSVDTFLHLQLQRALQTSQTLSHVILATQWKVFIASLGEETEP